MSGEKNKPYVAMLKNVGKKKKKKNLDSSLYLDPHQNLLGSILGRDPSHAQVLSKFVQCFFFPVILITNQLKKTQTNTCEQSLVV